jgi:two-component system sensor histidine kinase RegB
MIEVSRRPSFAAFVSATNEPQIVLAALTRLRWLAVIGQLAATGVAAGALRLALSLYPILGVILITAVSNALLPLAALIVRPARLVLAVLLLDVFLLTILLYLTGGPENPFAALYLIHVAMAVIVLRTGWTWLVVATVAACYGIILEWHRPLPLNDIRIRATGNWIALVLVSALIATFIGRVIRSLRQRELELASVRERASRSEQLAALTTLAAGAAHELNTPLGTIAVVARELEISCQPDNATSAVLEDARLIRREVDRCQTILSRMRVDIGDEGALHGVVSIADLEKELRGSINEHDLSRLRIMHDGPIDTISGSPRAIEQALLVLLRNAYDASAPGAIVTLFIQHRPGHVRFEVRDAGCGMSEEMLRRAGQPFFTTKEPGRGMGLGLFLVRLVAQQSGGTFAIDSHTGVGTTCILELPDGSGNN